MKVLFAVNNESISEAIVKKYQKEYKEIISYKNVYYFNAIQKEIQKDKSYDRIVISEDLEQFTNTSYEQMDKFIFDRLDSISDEATNARGEDIPIILICSERRNKSDSILIKLFGIGIYNAIIGTDRSIDEVCRLIQKPRLKKEAKSYYKIDSEEVGYQAENENDVSEIEIQNILAHYKRLGKDENKYIESFDNIAAQYNDNQLRIISKFLPLNVRAVLEERSPKYQKIMSFNSAVSDNLRNGQKTKKATSNGPSEKLLKSSKDSLTKPVVIPSAINKDKVKKLAKKSQEEPKIEELNASINEDQFEDLNDFADFKETQEVVNPQSVNEFEDIENIVNPNVENIVQEEQVTMQPKRGRGRPRKVQQEVAQEQVIEQPKRGRGRPRKVQPVVQEEDFILPGLEEKSSNKNEAILPGLEDSFDDDFILPGMDDQIVNNNLNKVSDIEENYTTLPGLEEYDQTLKQTESRQAPTLPGFDDEDDFDNFGLYTPNSTTNSSNDFNNETRNENNYDTYNNKAEISNIQSNNYITENNISSLLTGDKKVVSFVGTSKNGTSFIVNNIAEVLSSKGINTAILDTTQNRNSYYIYTKNEEDLRKVAFSSLDNLIQGRPEGIKVNRNLTVYTSLPDEKESIKNSGPILETLVKNHSVVLIDCDFSTPDEYFSQVQEIYLVQSMDVLTIQPLTAFLRGLKAKNILNENKLKIVINKYTKVRSITEKAIIGGMAFYNDPAMSFMTELFDRNLIKYAVIPFDEDVYIKYLEALINCDVSLKGYSKNFMQSLNQLSNMIYPLVSGKGTYKPKKSQYNDGFSASMNNTLNQMKQNY